MVQIYGRKKCSGTRKAQRFFSDRRIQVQNIDLDRKPPGKREIDLFVQVVGVDALVDKDGKIYRSRGLSYMEFDPVDELNENPDLLRTPIVRSGRMIVVGEDEAGWSTVADGASPDGASA
ncbi:MAG: ArsC/Spx/MgsR family protein [Spirochaetia bacterium]